MIYVKTKDYQWHVATCHNIMSGNMQGRQLLTNTNILICNHTVRTELARVSL